MVGYGLIHGHGVVNISVFRTRLAPMRRKMIHTVVFVECVKKKKNENQYTL
jgi:hypothetical protein